MSKAAGLTRTAGMVAFLPALLMSLVLVVSGPGNLCAQEGPSFLTFGAGKINVRFYADYFCGPCGAIEPVVEPRIADLVKRNVITITFIDAPFHTHSSLYTKYFLYILNENKEMGRILAARAALFDAARSGIKDKDRLEEFLLKKAIAFRMFDERPTLSLLQGYLREDKIDATPMMVVYREQKREVYRGGAEIQKGLESLK